MPKKIESLTLASWEQTRLSENAAIENLTWKKNQTATTKFLFQTRNLQSWPQTENRHQTMIHNQWPTDESTDWHMNDFFTINQSINQSNQSIKQSINQIKSKSNQIKIKSINLLPSFLQTKQPVEGIDPLKRWISALQTVQRSRGRHAMASSRPKLNLQQTKLALECLRLHQTVTTDIVRFRPGFPDHSYASATDGGSFWAWLYTSYNYIRWCVWSRISRITASPALGCRWMSEVNYPQLLWIR